MDMPADPAPPPPPAVAEAGAWAFLYDAEGHDREVAVEPGLTDQLHDFALLWVDV